MTGRRGGQGYNFSGSKAKAIKTRMRELAEEQRRTGRISAFDARKVAEDPGADGPD